jgi:septal ring factor EnvC (AmiA/AmiB activator)
MSLLLFLQSSVQQQLEALCELSPLCAPHLKMQKEVTEQLQAEISALHSKLRRSEAQVQLLQQQLEAAQDGQKD